MKSNRLCIFLLSLLLLFSGCTPREERADVPSPSPSVQSAPPSASGVPTPSPSAGAEPAVPSASALPAETEKTPEELAKETLAMMSLEEKAGQMFFLAFRKNSMGQAITELDAAAKQTIKTIQPGGVILFGENVDSTAQIRAFISDAQEASAVPLFVSVDHEGGKVQRIKPTDKIAATRIPPMLTVGAQNDLSLTQKIGALMGQELRVFGFNMNFAPVCDVFSNSENIVIGSRAFSGDPQIVAEQAAAMADGLSGEGIIPVLKHFPGHGDTADTHEGFAAIDKTLDELWECELIPFQTGIENGAEVIVTAHISLPEINGDMTPATLSKNILTDLLRGEMGYDGIIITDAMEMGAIADNYTVYEYIAKGVEAGVDMFLMPADPQKAFDTLVSCVKKGEIPMERLDESVLRILTLKYERGLFEETALLDESVLGSRADILEGIA